MRLSHLMMRGTSLRAAHWGHRQLTDSGLEPRVADEFDRRA